MNDKYIRKAITKALTRGDLANVPLHMQETETLTIYTDNYCAWAIPAKGFKLTHTFAAQMTSLSDRLKLTNAPIEVKDTGRRELRAKGKGKPVEIAIFACEEFEVYINAAFLKLFADLPCRFWAKAPDKLVLIEDTSRFFDGYAVGGVMPVKPAKRGE